MEINYSKKQINPLIEKYHINVTSNVVFQSLILLFNDQPNYQVWAIKAVFEGIATIDDIKAIHEWAENNPTEIKNLVKGNIVSYKTQRDFKQLFDEMNGLNIMKFLHDWANRFNTEQRKMLKDFYAKQVVNHLEALSNSTISRFTELFKGVSTLPKHRQEKLISTSSAIKNDMDLLVSHINSALSEGYTWDKEDMLGFMARNCKDCSVIYDKENIVIANIGSFDSSRKLCGGGRTGWCLTRQESYFKQYTKDNNNAKQYFIFNFAKREDHELAHIGVTVNIDRGITHAHTTRNNNLMGRLSIDNENVNIYDVLAKLGIPKKVFIHFTDNKNFGWDVEKFLKFVDGYKENVSLAYSGGNRFILNVHNKNALKAVTHHTFLNCDNYGFSKDRKVYVYFDFNVDRDDDNSVIVLNYIKDKYQIDTFNSAINGYNSNVSQNNVLEKVGITSDMYLNREDVDPKILLHKYIDERNEKAAIELLKKYGEELDVNFEFNNRKPIFAVIENNLFDLFGEMIEMPNFNDKVEDLFNETLFQSLLLKYVCDDAHDKGRLENDKKMIEKILNSKRFNINTRDLNDDTPIHITTSHDCLFWVFERLMEHPDIDLNIVNDFNCTPLGNAILMKNVKAVTMLLKRKDVVVREEDFELADNVGLNLKKMCENRENPTASIKTTTNAFAELFANALKFAK